MNISVIFWYYSTFPDSFPEGPLGGAERAAWEISRRLARKHQVRLFCKSESTKGSTDVDGVELVRISSLGSKWISSDIYFCKALKDNESDIVHSITAIEPCLYSDRVVLHLENDIRLHTPFPSAKSYAYGKNLSNIQMVIGVSRYILSKCIERLDLHESHKTVLINGADLDIFNPKKRDRAMFKERYGIEENDLVVMYSGYFAWKKGLHVLLDAIENTDLGIKLIIAGGSFYSKKKRFDTKYAENIYQRISAMPNVIHVGALDQRELSIFYASSDICVVPSLWQDPCPLVVAEAAASGLPIVGIASGGIPDAVIAEKTGYLTARNPASIRDAVSNLVSDDGLRRRMSLSSRKFAEKNLDWEKITAKIESGYRKLK